MKQMLLLLLVVIPCSVFANANDDLIDGVKNGEIEIVENVLENGVSFNIKDEDVMTALILVSEKNHLEVVKYLVSKDADVNTKIKHKGSMFFNEKSNDQRKEVVCKTTDECLDSINSENIHHTRWFKKLSNGSQYIVCAANTPEISDLVVATVKGIFIEHDIRMKQDKDNNEREFYKKGGAG